MRNRSYRKAAASVVMAACILATGCTANIQDTGGDPISSTGFMLDTVITITLYDGLSQENLDGALNVCAKYEQLLSKTMKAAMFGGSTTPAAPPRRWTATRSSDRHRPSIQRTQRRRV